MANETTNPGTSTKLEDLRARVADVHELLDVIAEEAATARGRALENLRREYGLARAKLVDLEAEVARAEEAAARPALDPVSAYDRAVLAEIRGVLRLMPLFFPGASRALRRR